MLLGTSGAAHCGCETGAAPASLARRGGAELALSARAVVIADGGFPGDPELFRRHIGPRPDLVLQRHAGTAVGDGIRMAEERAPR